MKIYFDGCSWTEGAELENPEEERYSKLFCNELGAEEINLAKSGGSNDRIVRNLLVENNIEDYDLAVVQMTYPVRTEFFKEKKEKWIKQNGWLGKYDNWVRVNPKHNYNKWLHGLDGNISRLGEKFEDHNDFWKYFYIHVTNEKYFEIKEKIHFQTIKNHCEVKKVHLILLTINQWTTTSAYQLNVPTLKRHHYGHPTKESHRLIADDLVAWTDPSRKPRILKKSS